MSIAMISSSCLRQTHMPAALLEAGSIVNRSEELELQKPERRKLVAAAVGEALDRYCQLRPPVEQAQEKQASTTPHTHGDPRVPFPPRGRTLDRAGTLNRRHGVCLPRPDRADIRDGIQRIGRVAQRESTTLTS